MEQTSQSSQVLPCVSILYVYLCHYILYWEDEATYPAYHRLVAQESYVASFFRPKNDFTDHTVSDPLNHVGTAL
jgi:hypothetical protein